MYEHEYLYILYADIYYGKRVLIILKKLGDRMIILLKADTNGK